MQANRLAGSFGLISWRRVIANHLIAVLANFTFAIEFAIARSGWAIGYERQLSHTSRPCLRHRPIYHVCAELSPAGVSSAMRCVVGIEERRQHFITGSTWKLIGARPREHAAAISYCSKVPGRAFPSQGRIVCQSSNIPDRVIVKSSESILSALERRGVISRSEHYRCVI